MLALEGAAEPETVEGVPHAWCRLGAAARGLALLRQNNVRELVLAGGIAPTFAHYAAPRLARGQAVRPHRLQSAGR